MGFYLSAVNQLVKGERDNPTIGIILCRSKQKTIVEFELDPVQHPIGVASYNLREDLPPALQGCLPTVKQLESELEAVVTEFTMEPDSES